MTKIDRIYLDYNATSPLCNNVKRLLQSGDFLFANPSSQHASGKKSRKLLTDSKKFILETFKLDSNAYDVIFHSGATEGLNTFFNLKGNDAFVYFVSDHPALSSIAKVLIDRGVEVKELGVDSNGLPNIQEVLEVIKDLEVKGKSVWVNYTYIHNETGIVWPLTLAEEIKKNSHAKIHIDAVQLIGKLSNDLTLSSTIDAYTFSSHKFGGLKGFGFSVFKKDISLNPFIYGGGQQDGLRSGTINIHGAQANFEALKEASELDTYVELRSLKEKLITILESQPKLEVIKNKTVNTICFLHENIKADIMLVHFDLVGLDVSSGSACSSGSISPSKTLLAMGYGDKAANNIRISLGHENIDHEEEIINRLQKVLDKL